MLLQMRQFTRSWVAYLLIFILAAMFVVFLGNGQSIFDALNTQTSNVLAKGRGVTVLPQHLSREFDLELRQQRQQGGNVDRQEAIDRGLHLQVLDRIVGRWAVFSYAERSGISASNAQVANRIREIPLVRNPVTDSFDQSAYQRFLRETGYTQPEFEREIRGEISANILMEALAAGARAPTSYGTLALTYQGETRVVSIAEADASVVGAIAPPTDAELQSFYEESQAQLRVPEFRALTLVFARTQDFVARVNVPEDRLNAEVEARRASAAQPERRTSVRISVQNEQQANEAAARLARGEAPSAIATALGAGVQAARSENQARADVPDSRVAEAVFSAPAGGAPRIVRGQLSPFVVVRVENVTAAQNPNLTELRETVRAAIATDEAGDLLNTAVSAFEEARDGGAGVTDAAHANSLAVVTIPAVTARGQGQDGRPLDVFTGHEDLLRTAFETPEGEASDFMPAGDADVVVAVDRIIPQSVRPLVEVKTQLSQLWVARERQKRLRELGQAVADAVRGGQNLAVAVRAHRMRIAGASQTVNRTTAGQSLPPALAAQIFNAREGGVAMEVSPNGDAVLVAVVEAIRRPNLSEAPPQQVEAARARMQQSLAESFGSAVQSQIVDSAHVRRNDRRIAQLFGADREDGEDPQ